MYPYTMYISCVQYYNRELDTRIIQTRYDDIE